MIAIVVTTYFVRRATIDIAAAVRGKKPPTWAGRRGFTGYVADLWDDAWEDARATHKRKRDTREATPAGQGRPAGFKRWFAAQWAAGWERLEAAHHAKRAGRAARPDPDEAAYPDPPKGAEYPESGPCQWCGKPAVTKVGRAGYGHIDPRTGLPGCDGVNFPDVTDPEYEEFPEDLIRPCPHCDGVQLPVIGTEGVDEDGRGTALVTCGKCGATDVGSWSTTDPDAPYEWVDSPPATTVTPPEYELYEGQSRHAALRRRRHRDGQHRVHQMPDAVADVLELDRHAAVGERALRRVRRRGRRQRQAAEQGGTGPPRLRRAEVPRCTRLRRQRR